MRNVVLRDFAYVRRAAVDDDLLLLLADFVHQLLFFKELLLFSGMRRKLEVFDNGDLPLGCTT